MCFFGFKEDWFHSSIGLKDVSIGVSSSCLIVKNAIIGAYV